MPAYDALKKKQRDLIRKALDGSVFIAPSTAAAITNLTTYTAATTTAPEKIELTALPAGYNDLGWLTTDGAAFAREVATSEVTSWGSVTPTRSDVTADTSTLSVTAQETNIRSIGLGTGVDMSGVTPAAGSGEVSLPKPLRASPKEYRALVLSVDLNEAGEIYIARFLPKAKVNGFSDQSFGGGDEPITWGVTLTGQEDAALGYSERWIFGGPGWKAELVDMGFPAAA